MDIRNLESGTRLTIEDTGDIGFSGVDGRGGMIFSGATIRGRSGGSYLNSTSYGDVVLHTLLELAHNTDRKTQNEVSIDDVGPGIHTIRLDKIDPRETVRLSIGVTDKTRLILALSVAQDNSLDQPKKIQFNIRDNGEQGKGILVVSKGEFGRLLHLAQAVQALCKSGDYERIR